MFWSNTVCHCQVSTSRNLTTTTIASTSCKVQLFHILPWCWSHSSNLLFKWKDFKLLDMKRALTRIQLELKGFAATHWINISNNIVQRTSDFLGNCTSFFCLSSLKAWWVLDLGAQLEAQSHSLLPGGMGRKLEEWKWENSYLGQREFSRQSKWHHASKAAGFHFLFSFVISSDCKAASLCAFVIWSRLEVCILKAWGFSPDNLNDVMALLTSLSNVWVCVMGEVVTYEDSAEMNKSRRRKTWKFLRLKSSLGHKVNIHCHMK